MSVPGPQDEAFLDSAAALVGLVIPDMCRPGVQAFLALAAGMAETLDAVDLADDDLALAPVYRLPDARRG